MLQATAPIVTRKILVTVDIFITIAILGAVFGFLAAILGAQLIKDDFSSFGRVVVLKLV